MLMPPPTAASKLRALLAQKDEIVVCPGVYDGFTARLALKAGFKILYMACHPYSVKLAGADKSRPAQGRRCQDWGWLIWEWRQ